MKDRYVIQARWWTGLKWEHHCRKVDTIDQAVSFVRHQLKNLRPYQLSITDMKSEDKRNEERFSAGKKQIIK